MPSTFTVLKTGFRVTILTFLSPAQTALLSDSSVQLPGTHLHVGVCRCPTLSLPVFAGGLVMHCINGKVQGYQRGEHARWKNKARKEDRVCAHALWLGMAVHILKKMARKDPVRM